MVATIRVGFNTDVLILTGEVLEDLVMHLVTYYMVLIPTGPAVTTSILGEIMCWFTSYDCLWSTIMICLSWLSCQFVLLLPIPSICSQC